MIAFVVGLSISTLLFVESVNQILPELSAPIPVINVMPQGVFVQALKSTGVPVPPTSSETMAGLANVLSKPDDIMCSVISNT